MSRNLAEVPSDEELACRAQRGCVASFEQLVRRFQGPVLHFLRHRALSADAEDLTQDTFLRVYENLHRYRRKWPFTAWLFTIARRVSMNHYRRVRLPGGCEVLETVADASPRPVQVLIQEESRRRLWDIAARTLSEEQMTALWLYYVQDLPVKEIAWVLGRSRVSVKTMMFRARKKLLPLLGELQDGGTPQAESQHAVRAWTPRRAALEVPHV